MPINLFIGGHKYGKITKRCALGVHPVLQDKMNELTKEGVLQEETCPTTGRNHYQGRFVRSVRFLTSVITN